MSLIPSSLSSSFPEKSAFLSILVDWKETPEAHVFQTDLPGLKKEEVKVVIDDDSVLQISGERSFEKEDENDEWHCVERSSGKFMRRFRLPENAKIDQVTANMENGVLTVTVPKQEEKKPEVKAYMENGVLIIPVPKQEAKKPEVKAYMKNGVLHIPVPEQEAKKPEVKTYMKNGVLHISVPEQEAKKPEVKAYMKNGVLHIPVPKQEAKKPEVKAYMKNDVLNIPFPKSQSIHEEWCCHYNCS